MSAFALISLVASAITILLGTFVYSRNPRGALNRVFFLYCLLGALWSFTEFGYRQAESFSRALWWLRASGLAIFAMPLELHFIIHFTENKWLERKPIRFLLYVPALALSIPVITGLTTPRPVAAYWGWTYTPRYGIFQNLLDLWFIVISSCGLILCLWYRLRKAEGEQKERAGLVLMALFIPFVLALITEPGGVFSLMGTQVPELTSTGFILECVVIGYAVQRYRLFALTPAAAADVIVATLTDALVLVDPEGRIAMVNRAAEELLGYRESELADQPAEMILAADEAASFEQARLDQLVGASPIRDAEVSFITKRGKEIPVGVSASVVRDQDDAAQGVVYVARDLTERKWAAEQIIRSLKEKDVLLREIRHRVMNNLQIISSLLMLQSEETTHNGAAQVLRASRNRVHSMAFIHEILYRSENLSEVYLDSYVRRLADHLLHSYDVDLKTIAVKIDVGQVSLSADPAIRCGLIINELISNSLEHAFPAGQTGEIHVGMHEGYDNRIILTVSDNGIGLPPDVLLSGAQSLGLQLVALLIQQLDGKVEVKRNGGTVFEIQFSA
jgi:PAS domain S-box-containing protein